MTCFMTQESFLLSMRDWNIYYLIETPRAPLTPISAPYPNKLVLATPEYQRGLDESQIRVFCVEKEDRMWDWIAAVSMIKNEKTWLDYPEMIEPFIGEIDGAAVQEHRMGNQISMDIRSDYASRKPSTESKRTSNRDKSEKPIFKESKSTSNRDSSEKTGSKLLRKISSKSKTDPLLKVRTSGGKLVVESNHPPPPVAIKEKKERKAGPLVDMTGVTNCVVCGCSEQKLRKGSDVCRNCWHEH